MASYTPNINLYKPNTADTIAVDTSLSDNFTIIDTEITKLKANKGSSTVRPTLTTSDTGFEYFDTTLNKPIWWTGTNWYDSTGSQVL